MATALGRIDWGLTRDDDGNRTYNLRWLVEGSVGDGPLTILGASGLASIGSTWGYGGDSDAWAFCHPESRVSPVLKKEPGKFWFVDQTFTTKPLRRCQSSSIENPLLEPARLGGSFVRNKREATQDRDGKALKNSSHETYRGAVTEVDDSNHTVRVGLNVLTMNLPLYTQYAHCLNDATLWGMSAETIKYSYFSWVRKLYGTCTYYYSLDMDFEVNYNGWTRSILDEGTRYLAPGGTDTNIVEYIQYKDPRGENSKVLLDGAGGILTDPDSPEYNDFDLYDTANLLLLGIPSTF